MTVRKKNSTSAASQAVWDEIATDFRQVCQQWAGRGTELARLQDDLRRTIDLWAQADRPDLPAAEDGPRADGILPGGGPPTEGAGVSPEHLAARLAGALMPAVCRQVSRELRQVVLEHLDASRPALPSVERGPVWSSLAAHRNKRGRIRFDDIPAVIDALLAEERATDQPAPAAAPLVLAARPGRKTHQLKPSPSRLARGGHSHKR